MATSDWSEIDAHGLRLAIDQAKKSYNEGGCPIGSAILTLSENSNDSTNYKVLGAGHNERIQRGSAILHGEMSALENAGRLKPAVYRTATLYTTLSPCSMCTGAILLYRIPRVVIGEDTTLKGCADYLVEKGVEVVIVDDQQCKDLMARFIEEKPEDWYEDIGEIGGQTNM